MAQPRLDETTLLSVYEALVVSDGKLPCSASGLTTLFSMKKSRGGLVQLRWDGKDMEFLSIMEALRWLSKELA